MDLNEIGQDKLTKLAHDIDEYFGNMCMKNEIDPLTMATVFASRAARINIDLGYGKEYITLMRKALDFTELTVFENKEVMQ